MSNSAIGTGLMNITNNNKNVYLENFVLIDVIFYRKFFFSSKKNYNLLKETIFRVKNTDHLIVRNITSKNCKATYHLDLILTNIIFFENFTFFGDYISNYLK